MLSNNERYRLLEKLDNEGSKWWSAYLDALIDRESGSGCDAAILAIAYLVESGCLTYEEVTEATKALEECSDWGIGGAAFIERVMKYADAVRARGGF